MFSRTISSLEDVLVLEKERKDADVVSVERRRIGIRNTEEG